MQITPSLSIDDAELLFTFVRASGPGGQNVNKVATAVQLRFNVTQSTALQEETKTRLHKIAGKRMTEDGTLIIEARRYRSQENNRKDAENRLVALIQKSLVSPAKRKPTRPTRGSQITRLETKRMKGEKKRIRLKNKQPGMDD